MTISYLPQDLTIAAKPKNNPLKSTSYIKSKIKKSVPHIN
jgi:hypothetical protein